MLAQGTTAGDGREPERDTREGADDARRCATAFVAGTVFAPDLTRLAALTGTLVAAADVLQYGFAGLQRAWSRGNKSR